MAHMRGGIRTTSRSERERNNPGHQGHEWQEEQAGELHENVGETERLMSGLIGGGLVLRSIMRPLSPISGLSALFGIALVHRSLTGYCPAYNAMGISTHEKSDTASLGRRKVHTRRALKIEQSIVIERSAKDLYDFWRQLDNLPTVMSQVQSVEPLDDRRSHWIIHTLPGVPTVEWDAEIISDVKNERIGWRTLQGAVVEHAGSVQFHPIDEDRSTRVTVTLQYDPPAGPIGAAIAGLFGQDPRRKIAGDLEQFKQSMESQAPSSR